jgi:hypothetical protein
MVFFSFSSSSYLAFFHPFPSVFFLSPSFPFSSSGFPFPFLSPRRRQGVYFSFPFCVSGSPLLASLLSFFLPILAPTFLPFAVA